MMNPNLTRDEWHATVSRAIDMARYEDRQYTDGRNLRATMRHLFLEDIFFVAVWVFEREDMDTDFGYQCAINEQNGVYDEGLLLRFRGGYKSTWCTHFKTLQKLAKRDVYAGCIFSHTKPIAKTFLREIKSDLEENDTIKWLFPDRFYAEPKSQAPKWSENEGIVIKRKRGRKEPSLMASGLVDGQPTGMHFTDRIYDDVVVRESVSTKEQIAKTTNAWSMSLNLGAKVVHDHYRGTPYDPFDTYKAMEDSGIKVFREPCIKGEISSFPDGEWEPIHFTRDEIMAKLRTMGPYTFTTQMLVQPVSLKAGSLKVEWLKNWWDAKKLAGHNIYLIIDPSAGKSEKSDFTAALLVGLSWDKKIRVIDMRRERIGLQKRWEMLLSYQQKFKPIHTFYEEIGMQSDRDHFRHQMKQINYFFNITPFGAEWNRLSKTDIIMTAEPFFYRGDFVLMEECIHTDPSSLLKEDLVHTFIEEEYKRFPQGEHDDLLNCFGVCAKLVNSGVLVFPDRDRGRAAVLEEIGATQSDEYTWRPE